LVELVKNSYDADAKRVEVGIFVNVFEPFIRVADNGDGMTEEEVDKYWLRIGYSHKVEEKLSALNRRKTGEKADVGTLSINERVGTS
jgi:HSP90 family molecular chaperone